MSLNCEQWENFHLIIKIAITYGIFKISHGQNHIYLMHMFSLILITIYIFKIIFTLKQKAIMLSKRQEFFIQIFF